MRRALIVDDNRENRYVLRALLAARGWAVVEAENGASALEAARAEPPDIAISDLLMPVMDGYTLLRRWKADPRLKAVPLVVYTATYTDPQDEKLALDLGADAFILKPAEPDVLMALLDRICGRAGRGEIPAAAPVITEEPVVLREYNEALVRRLEDKARQVEISNQDLSEREAHLRAILDTEPECVAVLAADGALLEMNPAGLRMLEADSLARLQHRCVFPLVAEEHRAAFRALTERVFRGENGTLEFEIVGLKGGRRWVETHATPLRDTAGKAINLLGITRDVTARKQAEAALRESEERFRCLSDAAFEGVVIHDQGRILEANQGFCDLYRCDRADEVIGKSVLEIAAPESRDAVRQHIRSGSEKPYEATGLRKDGTRIVTELRGRPLVFRGRNVRVVAVRDITARKQAEARARHLGRLYAMLSEVNQAIVRVKTREELFAAVCRAAVEHGCLALGWVGLLDRAAKTVTAVAAHAPDAATEELITLRYDLNDARVKGGLMGRSLATGRAAFSRDIRSDTALDHVRAVAEAYDLRASAVTPFRSGGEIAGFMVLASAETDYFSDPELQDLVADMGDDISYALDAMEADAQRRRAELAETHALALANATILSLPGIFYLFTAEGRFLRWNEEFEKATGYTGEEIAALHPTDFFTGDERDLIRQRIGRVFTEGSADGEAHFTAKDGTRSAPFYFTGRRLLLDGEPHLVGVGVDLSALRQAQKALHDLAQAVDAAGDVVFLTDREGIITHVNDRFTALYGFTAEEVVGKVTPRILASGKQSREFYGELWATLRRGEFIQRECVNRAKDGRLLDVEQTITPFRDDRGGSSGFLAVQREIGARKRAEAEARLLQTIALGVGAAADLDEALAFLLRQVCETTGWAMGEAWLPDHDGAQLVCHPVWHGAAPGLEEFRQASVALRFAAGEGLPGRVWQTKQPEWVPDLGIASRFARFEAGARAGLKAGLGVPVLAHGEVVLVLDFFLLGSDPEEARQVQMVAAVAAQIGVSVERQRVTQELRESEGKFRALFENSLDGLLLAAPDGRVVAANPAACRLLGRSESEICRLERAGLVDANDPRVGAFLDERARTGSARGELNLVRGDGSLIEVEVSSTVYATPAGARTAMIIHDVTERNRAGRMRALEHAVNRCLAGTQPGDTMATLLATICQTLDWDYGEYWRIGEFAAKLREEVSYAAPAVDFAGRRFGEISSGMELGCGEGLAGEAWRSGTPLWVTDVRVEPNVARREAARQAGLHSALLLPVIAQGRIIGVLGFWSRERREPDAWLHTAAGVIGNQVGAFALHERDEEALQRFRIAMDHSADIIMLVDRATMTYVDLNDTACRLLGYTREELLRMGPQDIALLPREEPARAYDELISSSAGAAAPPPSRATGVLRCKDGTTFPYEATRTVLRSGGRTIVVVVARDISERLAAEERLQYQAQHDALTDLPNRVLFRDRLEQALVQARRNAWNMAVLFVDIDRFKKVNDTLGHAAGDRLLEAFARRLASALRVGDTVGRLGGDEFGVILPEVRQAQDAARVAEKIAASLAAPFDIDGREIFASGSMGITVYPNDSDDAETLVRNADTAMYRAKEAGRNAYRFYEPHMNERALERLELEGDLRRALGRGEFVLHYQPKADMAGARVNGAEALLRWRRQGGALVPPMEFIPLLEETGLIVEVGDWVIRAACDELAKWDESPGERLAVAVNASTRQLRDGHLVESVRKALAETGCAPERLQIEITESAAMQDVEAGIGVLAQLRALGVKVAIDDFGTGHSSLAYLQRLPIDIVKIDRRFVRDIHENAGDEAIARAIVAMARAFGYRVVAEGVENARQQQLLEAIGCDEMQGYLLGKPMPAEEFVAWLGARRDALGG